MALTSEEAARIETLAAEYDRDPSITLPCFAPPCPTRPASFAEWMTARGEAELLAALEVTLRELGDAESLRAVRERPPAPAPTPEEIIASFDAPLTPGPWALNASGKWFRVTSEAPGSRVVEVDGREIYIPAEHPSVRIKENAYGGNVSPEVRFTSQKFRAASAAVLGPDPFRNLFFRVAPRGGRLGAGRAFQDTPDDYESEGGELYPGLTPSDPIAATLNDWWRRQNLDPRYGYDRGITLNWLRVYTDADGFRRYRAWSGAEVREFFNRWQIADAGFVCTPKEIAEYIGDTLALQAERQGAQTERDYSVHWPWIIGPLSQCSVPSRRRRMENVRKAAAIAAVVTGAIFLGPMIAGKLKLLGAKIGGAIKGAVTGRIEDAVKGEKETEGEIERTEREVAAELEDPETQAAIESGELPPPDWADYALSVGTALLERELAESRAAIADASARGRLEVEDASARAQREAALAAEIARVRAQAERVASGATTPERAATEITAAGVSGPASTWGMIGIAAAIAAAVFAAQR
jgi:hypothetical protein